MDIVDENNDNPLNAVVVIRQMGRARPLPSERPVTMSLVRSIPALTFLVVNCCLFGLFATAGEPERKAMANRIDELILKKLNEAGLQPAPLCSDEVFLRRVTLDLIGTNPTPSEIPTFSSNEDSDKRDKLIDRLTSSPACAVHLADTWSQWLLPENPSPESFNGRDGLHTWLRNRFSENLRYDRLVADLLVSSGTASSGPGQFFLSLEGKPEKIAAKTARVFLGVQLDCAECHDHPFDHWKQRDFWSFAAYFAQLSADPMRVPGGMPEVIDKTEGDVTLPGSEEIVSPRPLVTTGLSGLASGTRRQQLTLWLTARENPYLARAAVNRCWSLMFGRGLIEPIDDMRSLESASHPEVLDELSKYFAASGYDLRELLKTIAQTQAYQRAGRHPQGPVPDGSYAIMPAKPLTSRQMAACLRQTARILAGPNGRAQADALAIQLGKLRGDGGHAALGIVQALVTLHAQQMESIYREKQSRLLNALTAPHLKADDRVQWLFLCTVARAPKTEEMSTLATLTSPTEPSSDAAEPKVAATEADLEWQSDLLWALINSTEFAMTP